MRRSTVRTLAAAAASVVAAALLAGCGAGRTDSDSSTAAGSGKPVTVGTTDKVVALDPAGSYDNGSLLLELQLYQFLYNSPAGTTVPAPDAAEKCSFTSDTEYTCTMKSGLKFSNGDPLTAKDVAFSFQRIVTINDPNGPASLLANMDSVKATDDSTVVFTLKNANDQTFPYILGTSAGPIVDSKVFPADKLLDDEKIVGSGPYKISSYDKNQLVQLATNANYTGNNKPANSQVTLKYYTGSDNLKLDIQSGNIDVAWRSLTPTDIDSLGTDKNVKVLTGPGGELRYMVFNFKTMPGDDDDQKLAIRQAVAYSVDRAQIASDVYKDTYEPVYSMIPDGLPGHIDAFKDAYGESPDKSKAQGVLSAAGVSTPVSLNLQYTTDHYGPQSDQEYNEIKRQLEATGLFTVNLQSTEWASYSKERVKDAYPVYQLGWFPDFSDGDNYLSPFLVEDNFVSAHYCDPGASDRPCDKDDLGPELTAEQTGTGDARTAAFEKIQTTLATGQMPYLPLLQGKQVAIVRSDINGVQDTLDGSFQFRFWKISKS